MASVSRKVRREVDRRFRKLHLTRMDGPDHYVESGSMEDHFGMCEENQKKNFRGDLVLSWIKGNEHKFQTGVREYQRFKVKDLGWKQTIVEDVLLSGIRVAELIIRVKVELDEESNMVISLEVIDGQQRITAFIEFVTGLFKIRIGDDYYTYQDLETKAPSLYRKVNSLTFGAMFYENITDEEASVIFNKVNDQTNINCQENRNAIFGPYSTYVRDRSFYGGSVDLHWLFERGYKENGNYGKVSCLVNFPKLDISKQRMEQLEWFSELIHWNVKGLRSNISQDTHTLWQLDLTGKVYEGKRKAEHVLKIASMIMKAATPDQRENDITPMILQFMTLWYAELTDDTKLGGYWGIVIDDYVNGFLNIVDDYSYSDDQDKKRAKDGERCRAKCPLDGKSWKLYSSPENDMKKFKDLFGGKNMKAIMTILSVLEYELKANPKQFGAKALDPEKTFPRSMVIEKWKEQGKCDAETGEPLELINSNGDHIIPHSHGMEAGGVTTKENLQVIAKHRNLKKGNHAEWCSEGL